MKFSCESIKQLMDSQLMDSQLMDSQLIGPQLIGPQLMDSQVTRTLRRLRLLSGFPFDSQTRSNSVFGL